MTDIEIAQAAKAEPITKIAERAGIPEEYLELYGSNQSQDLAGAFPYARRKEAGEARACYRDNADPGGRRQDHDDDRSCRTRSAESGRSPLSRCASRRSDRYSA